MARAQLRHNVKDAAGNVIQNALCSVFETGTTTPVADLYAAVSGGSPITTLTSDAQGDIIGWITVARPVDILVTDHTNAAYYPSAPSRLLSFADFTETVTVVPRIGTSAGEAAAGNHAHDGTYALKSPWLEGVPYRPNTHSYGNVQSPANCSMTYVDRLTGRHVLALTKRSNNGYFAQDVAGAMIGTVGTAMGVPIKGLVSIDAVQNDMRVNAAAAAGINGFKHALEAMIRRCRAASVKEQTDASFTFTGTWTTTTGAWYSGGNCKYTTTQNDKVDIAVSGALQYQIWSLATQTAHGVGQILLDGVDTGLSFDNSGGNQALVSTSTLASTSAPWVQVVTCPDSGAHTITLKKTDAGGGRVFIDAMCPVSVGQANRPLVVVHKQPYMPQSVYDGWANGISDATVDLYNAAIDAVVALFSDNVLAMDLNALGWNRNTMSSTVSGVTGHPNDRGMAFISDAIEATVHDYQAGLNIGL